MILFVVQTDNNKTSNYEGIKHALLVLFALVDVSIQILCLFHCVLFHCVLIHCFKQFV